MSTTMTAPADRKEMAIAQLLKWSEPKRVETKRGPRLHRKAVPDENFWNVWRRAKQALKEAGVSVFSPDNCKTWVVNWWQDIPQEEQQTSQERIVESRAEDLLDPNVTLPVPAGLEYNPYQKAGINYASKTPNTLIADEMGLGKTIQAIGVINTDAKIARVLIICPNSLKLNWERELRKWLVRKMTIGIADSQCFPSTDIVIINYDVIHKWQQKTAYYWDLLVVDEAHYMKNPKARRTKFILGFNGRGESKNVPAIPARRKIYMTGTPIMNKPVEVWPMISSLDPKTWSNFFSFAKRYCDAKQLEVDCTVKCMKCKTTGRIGGAICDACNGRGKKKKQVWDFNGASNLDELQRKLRSTIMVRRLKIDVLKDLPPKTRQVIELPPDGAENLVAQENRAWEGKEEAIAEAAAEMELAKAADDKQCYADAVAKLKKGITVAFTEMSRVRHETALAKLPQCIDHIRDIIDERGNGKILIFAHHLDVIDGLHRAFPGSVVITGETPATEKDVSARQPLTRQAICDRFQEDPNCGPFIGNMKAAGVGLTLTAADMVIFVELDWVPANVSQAEDRAHRYGQTRNVLIQHLVLAGSLDANIARKIVKKQDISDRALDTELAAEPIVPMKRDSVTISQAELAEAVSKITPEQANAIHLGLQVLAGVCNGARSHDGAGFSKIDTNIGKSLALAHRLSPKQLVLGAKLCNKYRRQLGEEIINRCGLEPVKSAEDE